MAAPGHVQPIWITNSDGRYRRILPVSARPGEGLLTEPIAGVQPAQPELVFMPPFRSLPRGNRTAAAFQDRGTAYTAGGARLWSAAVNVGFLVALR